jgi:hypothetical protein
MRDHDRIVLIFALLFVAAIPLLVWLDRVEPDGIAIDRPPPAPAARPEAHNVFRVRDARPEVRLMTFTQSTGTCDRGFTACSPSGELLVEIEARDGVATLRYGAGYHPDEKTRSLWEGIRKYEEQMSKVRP